MPILGSVFSLLQFIGTDRMKPYFYTFGLWDRKKRQDILNHNVKLSHENIDMGNFT